MPSPGAFVFTIDGKEYRLEPGLEAVSYYDPPNMTYPFGAYICVMDIDVDTGVFKVRRFYALDDCGTRINPMIIEGQIHGGLTEGYAMASMQQIAFDEDGNCLVLPLSVRETIVNTRADQSKTYTDWLPSFNARFDFGRGIIARVAVSSSEPAKVLADFPAMAVEASFSRLPSIAVLVLS